MSFPNEIKTRLTAQGITATILVGSKITQPESGNFLHLREYPGLPPFRIHNTGAVPAYVRPAMQITAHATNRVDAHTLIYQAYNAIIVRNTVLSGTRYLLIEPKQEPYDLGLDSKGRIQYAFNVETLKTPS